MAATNPYNSYSRDGGGVASTCTAVASRRLLTRTHHQHIPPLRHRRPSPAPSAATSYAMFGHYGALHFLCPAVQWPVTACGEWRRGGWGNARGRYRDRRRLSISV